MSRASERCGESLRTPNMHDNKREERDPGTENIF